VKRPAPALAPTVVLRRRLQLLLIAALFLGPLALSFWSYYGVALRPSGRSNHGELIEPARPLPALALATAGGSSSVDTLLHGKWSLAYLAGSGCDAACRGALAQMRGVRLALGADTTRVQRVLLVVGACCDPVARDAAGAELAVAHVDGAAATRLLAVFPEYDMPAAVARRIYLIDPLGNLMMSYAPGAAAEGMIKDLERLLRLSHIG
jgi:hypothetical protein